MNPRTYRIGERRGRGGGLTGRRRGRIDGCTHDGGMGRLCVCFLFPKSVCVFAYQSGNHACEYLGRSGSSLTLGIDRSDRPIPHTGTTSLPPPYSSPSPPLPHPPHRHFLLFLPDEIVCPSLGRRGRETPDWATKCRPTSHSGVFVFFLG